MKKTPTIFVRDMTKQPALVVPEWKAGCEWVRDGEGIATRKYDGTCCLIQGGMLYRRRELKKDQPAPTDFVQADFNDETGKTVGWVPVGAGDEDKWYREAFDSLTDKADGTYELLGPKTQGNKDKFPANCLIKHSDMLAFEEAPRSFDELKAWLAGEWIEGLVWHHPDGRMAKIKRRDFGLKW